MARKSDSLYFVKLRRGKAVIKKHALNGSATLARYEISDGVCSCPGHCFHGNCRHLRMVFGILPHARKVPHVPAWKVGVEMSRRLILGQREQGKRVHAYVEKVQDISSITQVCIRVQDRGTREAYCTFSVVMPSGIVLRALWNGFDPDWIHGLLGQRFRGLLIEVGKSLETTRSLKEAEEKSEACHGD